MLDPVIAMCQLQSQVRNRKCLPNVNEVACKGDAEQVPRKKLKTSIYSSHSSLKHGSCREVRFHFLGSELSFTVTLLPWLTMSFLELYHYFEKFLIIWSMFWRVNYLISCFLYMEYF